MHSYVAYGLLISSDIELPELVLASVKPDPSGVTSPASPVIIHRGKIVRSAADDPGTGSLCWARAGDACLFYEGIGAYRILGGSEVILDLVPGVEAKTVRLFLLGPALAILLHQRGLLVLHASGVAVNGRIAVFAAEKGEGKSTLAAAMHARGHPLVTDDLLPVDVDNAEQLMAHPGFPQLKLMPEAAAQLSEHPDELPRLHPEFEKRAQSAQRNFPSRALPLARIFILETGDRDAIDSIPVQQRFIELVRHSYLAPLLSATGESALHFRQVVRLAERVGVHRFIRRRNLGGLPECARMIEAEMSNP